jgi:starch synthase
MEKSKVLYVSQEIMPYLADSLMGKISRYLPQFIQEKGNEIRTFMPRFGHINERRNQLHEVIRLSGMNIIINDTDHPLILKVASIQSARMQVYFIENDDFFQRKFAFRDKNLKFFKDNDERTIFFNRGVIETVKKLGWAPSIIHLHGWMSSLSSIYIKTIFKENPLFYDSKVIISLYDDSFSESFSSDFDKKVRTIDMEKDALGELKQYPNYLTYMKLCLKYADGVVFTENNIPEELKSYIIENNIPSIVHNDETYLQDYENFYDTISVNEEIYS